VHHSVGRLLEFESCLDYWFFQISKVITFPDFGQNAKFSSNQLYSFKGLDGQKFRVEQDNVLIVQRSITVVGPFKKGIGLTHRLF